MSQSATREYDELHNTARDIMQSLAVLVVLMGIVCGALYGVHSAVQHFLPHVTLWQTGIGWYICGIACALFWPLRFFSGMRGSWNLETLAHIVMLGFTGPFALLLGYPL